MNILITGGTGFIGRALCQQLLANGHQLVVLSRRPAQLSSPIIAIDSLSKLPSDRPIDAVVNLAGEPIADKRWSQRQQQRIVNSRMHITQALINYFKSTTPKPQVFISGSAIGYYGIHGEQIISDELQDGDSSFSSQLCQQWEALAMEAQQLGIRTCLLRTGIVLGKHGGALQKMLLPFKLGLGGKIGSGQQWMPWIHLQDVIGIIEYCLQHNSVNGPINVTAPQPVTNQNFSRALGHALHRPAILPMPAFVIRLLFGQMGTELLLSGKKVLPAKILAEGYTFKYQNLEQALKQII